MRTRGIKVIGFRFGSQFFFALKLVEAIGLMDIYYCCPLKFKIEGITSPRCTKIGDMCFFSEE